MTVAIRAHGLGKRYLLTRRPAPNTLVESARETVKGILAPQRRRRDEFWALRDIGFDVPEGQVAGIIGANGAGKSTFLKILAGITDPTEGRVEVRGRVGSLLEVGAGFHPELSGRDNIYLNGAVLGMRRSEIARKYDEIVEFSGVADFIDIPVKRYSSGMYVRLAFAVAAHLEPEILLVDEVLSVGDQVFQEKSLARIHEVTREGRTVLFVSHNLASLLRLCDRGILLDHGRVVADGTIEATVSQYLARRPVGATTGLERAPRSGSGAARFTAVAVAAPDGGPVTSGGAVEIRLVLHASEPLPGRDLVLSVGIANSFGDRLATLLTTFDPDNPLRDRERLSGDVGVSCFVPELPLRPGRYLLTLYASAAHDLLDHVQNHVAFDVVDADYFGTGMMPTDSQGPLLVRHRWALEEPALADAGRSRAASQPS